MRVVMFVAILLGVVMAGCLGGDDDIEEDDGEDFNDDLATMTGVVNDAGEFEPLEGVRVRLIQDGETFHETNTTMNGTYLIGGIEPGQYNVQLFTPIAEPKIDQVNIRPGQLLEKDYLLELTEAPVSTEPYSVLDDFSGLWSCAVTHVTDNHVAPCQQFDDAHQWFTTQDIEPGLRSVTAEVDWTPSTPSAEEMRFRIINQVGGDHVYVDEIQSPPLTFQLNAEDLQDEAEERQFEFYDDPDRKLVLRFEVRPAGPGVVYQQEFTINWAFHYWENAPSGFSPSGG